MRALLFVFAIAWATASVAESPYVSVYVASATDDCSSDCSSPSEVKKPAVGISSGIYFGDKVIAGAEVYFAGTEAGAGAYVGVSPVDGVKAVVGAGTTLLGVGTDTPSVAGRKQIEDSADGDFVFAEASWNRIYLRYTIFDIQNDYSYQDQVGVDGSGNPIYGPVTSYSTEIDRKVVSVGYRYSF